MPDQTNEFPQIDYHYRLLNDEDSQDGDLTRPQLLFTLPDDSEDSFFITGSYRGKASIMKMYKKNAALRWHASLDMMTRLDAIAPREPSRSGQFFGCGSNFYGDLGTSVGDRPAHSEAWIFYMDSDGDMKWSMEMSGVTTG